MIEFHLDGRSGVSPYLQLVQQVRRAMRLGLLGEGDQLPTVKDVVGELAINPNTVLKAYRELEHEGLVSAKPGVGTFVTRTLDRQHACFARPAAPGPAALAREGSEGRARRREHRGALPRHVSPRRRRGHRVTSVSAGRGARQEVRPEVGTDGLLPRHPRRPRGRPGRSQRRRQEHAAQLVGRHADPHRRQRRGPRRPRPAAICWRRSGSSARTPRRTARLSIADHLRLGAELNPELGRRPGTHAGSNASASTRRRRPASCPAASARSWP